MLLYLVAIHTAQDSLDHETHNHILIINYCQVELSKGICEVDLAHKKTYQVKINFF